MKTSLSDFTVESPGGDLFLSALNGFGVDLDQLGVDTRQYARRRPSAPPRAPVAARRAAPSIGADTAGPIQVTIQCVNFDWQRVAFIGVALAIGVGLGWLVATAAGAKAAAVAAAAL